MQQYGRNFQCTGVPMFIIDGKFVLNGAQESDQFLRVFSKLGQDQEMKSVVEVVGDVYNIIQEIEKG